MKILCHKCGNVLAEQTGDTITVAGHVLPTSGLASVVLKCDSCKRTRDWHFARKTPPNQNGATRYGAKSD